MFLSDFRGLQIMTSKTIEHRAIDMLNRRGWKFDSSRRSPAWIDPLGRTKHAIYLGSRGSIRYGYNRTESRPVPNGLDGLDKFLASVETRPLPDTSELDAKRKANDDRKAELVKLHNALKGITPVYMVELIEYINQGEDGINPTIFDSEEFNTLDEVQAYINERTGQGGRATHYNVWVKITHNQVDWTK